MVRKGCEDSKYLFRIGIVGRYGLMDLMAWLPSTIAVFLLMETYDPWNAPFIKRMPLVLHACTMIRIIKVSFSLLSLPLIRN